MVVDTTENDIQEPKTEKIMVDTLKKKLRYYKNLVEDLQGRISDEASIAITKSGRFDLGVGTPISKIVDMYDELFTQVRMEVIEEIKKHPIFTVLSECNTTLIRLLISMLYTTYKHCFKAYESMLQEIENAFHNIKESSDKKYFLDEIIVKINVFMKKEAENYNVDQLIKDSENSLSIFMGELRDILDLKSVNEFVRLSVKVSWLLVTQHPKIVLEYTSTHFDEAKHSRYHTSSSKKTIITYVWPTLIEEKTNRVIYKGVVLT